LKELEKAEAHAIISLAVKFGRTRLIDNIILE
jgi:pantothenate synthetase